MTEGATEQFESCLERADVMKVVRLMTGDEKKKMARLAALCNPTHHSSRCQPGSPMLVCGVAVCVCVCDLR